MGVTGTRLELPERALNIICISLKFLHTSVWNPPICRGGTKLLIFYVTSAYQWLWACPHGVVVLKVKNCSGISNSNVISIADQSLPSKFTMWSIKVMTQHFRLSTWSFGTPDIIIFSTKNPRDLWPHVNPFVHASTTKWIYLHQDISSSAGLNRTSRRAG